MLQAYVPPVFMQDDVESELVPPTAGSSDVASSAAGESAGETESGDSDESDEEELLSSLPEQLRDSEEYRELLRLKELRHTKSAGSSSAEVEHVGYQVTHLTPRSVSVHCMFIYFILSKMTKRELL